MRVPRPHFLLYSDAGPSSRSMSRSGGWRFVLQAADGDGSLEVADEEPDSTPDRLALLAVVRGLEALEQPSQVTLVTESRYVARGLRFGLREFRDHDWFGDPTGTAIPVRNGDLWRRVDHALQFHDVQCRPPREVAGGERRPQWRAERLGQPRVAMRDTFWRTLVWAVRRLAAWFRGRFRFGRLFSSPTHATC